MRSNRRLPLPVFGRLSRFSREVKCGSHVQHRSRVSAYAQHTQQPPATIYGGQIGVTSVRHSLTAVTRRELPRLRCGGRGMVAPRVLAAQEEVPSTSEPDAEFQIPPGFTVPEPKRFTVANGQLATVASAGAAPLLRLGTGLFCLGYSPSLAPTHADTYAVGGAFGRSLIESSSLLAKVPRPAQPLELYEFEGCPFCRKVREMVTVLDLDVLYYPCPKDGPTYRPKAFALGGKKQFPYMVDPNTNVSLYESDSIIQYMAKTYGDGSIPLLLRLGPITAITAGLALLPRGRKGSKYVAAKKISKPIEVWSYESSPFCKIVREALCELELPHLYHSTGRGSPKRQKFFEEKGRFQVPYIEDPNTGVNMYESAAIVEYLFATYAIGTA